MSEILFHYQKVNPTTWVYLSSLLVIASFFRFNRFWSVRNLDLVLLLLLAPGLLMVNQAREEGLGRGPLATASFQSGESTGESAAATAAAPTADLPEPLTKETRQKALAGYMWLLGVSLLWLLRLLLDPTMVRRPLLEPNSTSGSLIFTSCALFLFLMANVITSDPSQDDLGGARGGQNVIDRHDTGQEVAKVEDYRRYGPGFYLLNALPNIPTHPFIRGERRAERTAELVAKTMAIASHLAVVIALAAIGYLHFENVRMGVGAAALYLMLPYTAQMTGHVDHVLPAALLLWAVVAYRRPMMAGTLIGLSLSVFYYPLFLLPLWISFYWQRGLARFIMGLLGSIAVMVFSLVFVSQDLNSFWLKLQPMFALWVPVTSGLRGIWGLGWDPWYRLPVIAACAALAGGLAIWPSHKNLGTLLSCSAAVMVAVQFWHGFGDGGGMYMAWYLPLLLMTVFRPNLEDRVALTVLGQSWFHKRRGRPSQLDRAA